MMFGAYAFRPYDAAKAFVLDSTEHHTEHCAKARVTDVTQPPLAVCYCDLPAHVKEMQDEAMTAASQVVINDIEKALQAVAHRIAAGDPPDVIEANLKAIVVGARKRYRA